MKRTTAIEYFERATAWDEERDYNKAIKDYSKAIALDPKYAWAYSRRGHDYSKKGDFDRAIADYLLKD